LTKIKIPKLGFEASRGDTSLEITKKLVSRACSGISAAGTGRGHDLRLAITA